MTPTPITPVTPPTPTLPKLQSALMAAFPTLTHADFAYHETDLYVAPIPAVQAVYNAINEDNRAKFDRIPLPRLLDFVWKSVK